MTILDPISGKRVDISAFGKPRDRCASGGFAAHHAVLQSVAIVKDGRHDQSAASNRASDQDVGGGSGG